MRCGFFPSSAIDSVLWRLRFRRGAFGPSGNHPAPAGALQHLANRQFFYAFRGQCFSHRLTKAVSLEVVPTCRLEHVDLASGHQQPYAFRGFNFSELIKGPPAER